MTEKDIQAVLSFVASDMKKLEDKIDELEKRVEELEKKKEKHHGPF